MPCRATRPASRFVWRGKGSTAVQMGRPGTFGMLGYCEVGAYENLDLGQYMVR